MPDKNYHNKWNKGHPESLARSQRKFYLKNKEAKCAYAAARRESLWKQWMKIFKQKFGEDLRCKRCGYNEFFSSMDFHHIDPKKKRYSINLYRSYKITKDRIAELDNVILVCKNCHYGYYHGKQK